MRIAGNEFLFDVVQDPRERANLKDRYRGCFRSAEERLGGVERHHAGEERPRPAAYAQPGNLLADHYGVVNPAPAQPPVGPAQR